MYSNILNKTLRETSEEIARVEAFAAKETAMKTNHQHILYGYGQDVKSTRYFLPTFVSDDLLKLIGRHYNRVCCLHVSK